MKASAGKPPHGESALLEALEESTKDLEAGRVKDFTKVLAEMGERIEQDKARLRPRKKGTSASAR